jgi:hypothetical protein
MKITSLPLALAVFVIFIGGIFFSDWVGWWQTTSTKVPVTFTTGEAAGEYNPADIRGSYTLGETSTLFAIPLEDLAVAFRVPANEAETFQLKLLESIYAGSDYEIGTASVRLFVAWYKGLPYDLSEETYLPLEAAQILRQKAALDAEQLAYLDTHTVQADGSLTSTDTAAQPPATPTAAPAETQQAGPKLTPTPAPGETEHVAPDRTITGKTTFQDLLDWGLTREVIEQTCGFPLPPTSNTLVKDAVNANGGSFPTVKTALQALITE